MVRKDLYGYGFTALSIKNKKHAVNGEMLSDRDAGLVAIYHKDTGSVISAEQLSREKDHLARFIQHSIDDGTVGKIQKIRLDDNLVQNIITSGNLFVNPLVFGNGNEKLDFIRFDIDYDCFLKDIDYLDFNPADVYFDITFAVTKDFKQKYYYIHENLRDINNKAFKVPYKALEDDANPNNGVVEFKHLEKIYTRDITIGKDGKVINVTTNAGKTKKDDTIGYGTGSTEQKTIDKEDPKQIMVESLDDKYQIVLNSISISLPSTFDKNKVGFVIRDILFEYH